MPSRSATSTLAKALSSFVLICSAFSGLATVLPAIHLEDLEGTVCLNRWSLILPTLFSRFAGKGGILLSAWTFPAGEG